MRELSPVCEEVESGFGFLEQVRRQKVRSLARIIAGRIRPSELLPYMHGIEKDQEVRNLEDSSTEDAAIMLLDELLTTWSQGTFAMFLDALGRCGYTDVLEYIDSQMTTEPDDSAVADKDNCLKMYIKILQPEIIERLDPIAVSVCLLGMGYISDGESESILNRRRNSNTQQATWLLLNSVTRRKSGWLSALIRAIANVDLELAKDIDPGFVSGTDKNEEKFVRENDRAGQNTEDEENYPDSTPQTDLCVDHGNNNLNISPADAPSPNVSIETSTFNMNMQESADNASPGSSDVDSAVGDATALPLRHYQLELAEKALAGENCIICSPTGSGKTRVSLHIALHHLRGAPKGQRKIVFMAKTVPLAKQQHKTYSELLKTFGYKVALWHGEKKNVLQPEDDVIVVTPQVLEDQLIENRVDSICYFSLFIFDECHHTVKEDPYNRIMARYRALLLDAHGRGIPAARAGLPQIVGLTASLGVGGSDNDYSAETYIMHVMANLNCYNICTVERHKQEMAEFVNTPSYDAFTVPGRKDDPFERAVFEVMKEIETMIDHSDAYLYIENKVLKPPAGRSSQMYEAWVVNLANEASINIDHSETVLARTIKACTDYLRHYYIALDVYHLARTNEAVDHLKTTMKKDMVHKDKFDATEKLLFQKKRDLIKYAESIENDPRCQNPKLDKLKNLLCERLAYNGERSRGIVFVKTRWATSALYQWMQSCDQLAFYKPQRFVGARTQDEEAGMTQNDQEEIISKFRDGGCRIIISTSFCEEGLDIPDCNLIIRYNYVTNEIAMVQAKGRTRTMDATAYLIGDEDVVEKDRLNKHREKLMHSAICRIKRLDHASLADNFIKWQKEDKFDREVKAMSRQMKEDRKQGGEFTLRCKKCLVHATTNNGLRVSKSKHHLVLDEQFDEKIKVQPKKKSRQFDGMKPLGSIHCVKCGLPWGIRVQMNNQHFSVLAIKNFAIVHPDGKEKSTVNAWIDAPFKVEQYSEVDFQKIEN